MARRGASAAAPAALPARPQPPRARRKPQRGAAPRVQPQECPNSSRDTTAAVEEISGSADCARVSSVESQCRITGSWAISAELGLVHEHRPGNASALSPLATNEPVRFGHCCWLRCCRIPGSAWLADVRACWLHDGRSHSPHQPPIPRDDPATWPATPPTAAPFRQPAAFAAEGTKPAVSARAKTVAIKFRFILFPYRRSDRRTLTVKQMEQKKIPLPCSRIPLSLAFAEKG